MPRLLLLIPTTSYRAEEFTAAARSLGVEVTVATEQASSLAARNPASLLELPFGTPAELVRRAREFASRFPIDAVVGADEAVTLPAALVAEALGLPHNPAAAVAAATNKRRQREILAAAGLPVPAFTPLSLDGDLAGAAAGLTYPRVVKPLSLSGSRGVIRADHPAQLLAACARIKAILAAAAGEAGVGPPGREVLAEAFVPGAEIALEGLLIDGRLRVLCLFDKPDPLDGPFFAETLYITPSRLPLPVQTAAAAAVEGAARALGLREGPVHAELRVNPHGVWLLEVHPRSIGGRCSRVLRFGTGMSLEEIILRQALGMTLGALEREPMPAGVLMLPVPRAGVLREIRGLEAAAALPGVEEVLLTAHPGQVVAPLPDQALYLGFVFARGGTTGFVEHALRSAGTVLEMIID